MKRTKAKDKGQVEWNVEGWSYVLERRRLHVQQSRGEMDVDLSLGERHGENPMERRFRGCSFFFCRKALSWHEARDPLDIARRIRLRRKTPCSALADHMRKWCRPGPACVCVCGFFFVSGP